MWNMVPWSKRIKFVKHFTELPLERASYDFSLVLYTNLRVVNDRHEESQFAVRPNKKDVRRSLGKSLYFSGLGGWGRLPAKHCSLQWKQWPASMHWGCYNKQCRYCINWVVRSWSIAANKLRNQYIRTADGRHQPSANNHNGYQVSSWRPQF
jgi:hypothetical protein